MKKLSTTCLLVLFSACIIWAQQRTVTGKVTSSADGSGLPGVNVLIQGTTTGTTTDLDGNYALSIPEEATNLVYSFVGFRSQLVVIGNRSGIDIAMEEDVAALEEVVVTGYSTQRRGDITGAVAVVDVEQMNKLATTSFVQKLEGQATGVNISTSGEPGEGTTVRIRGIGSFNRSEPLYIIDGVPVVDAFSTGLNPNDIESIQVLKDASAASIYGARASNGVIIVTTKKGQPGRVRIDYNGYVGTASPINEPSLMNPTDYSNYVWDRHDWAGIAVDAGNPYSEGRGVIPTYSYPYPDDGVTDDDYSFPDNLVMRANPAGTNWFDEIFEPAIMTEHNLAVSGGTENANYYFSAGYLNQQSTMIHGYFKRFSLRSNTEFKLGRVTIGENATFLRGETVGNDGVGGGNQDEQGIMTWQTLMHSMTPVHDVSGVEWGGDKSQGMSNGTNPVAELTRNKDNPTKSYRILGSVYAEVDIIEGLKARTSFGFDKTESIFTRFDFPNWENREPSTSNSFREEWRTNFNWTWTNTMIYNRIFAERHSLNVLAGYEAIENTDRGINGQLNNYFTQDINAWYINTGIGDPGTRAVDSFGGSTTLNSIFGKVDYSYDDRYLVSATIRHDGASVFGENQRWGTFPAFNIAWRISEEQFMSGVSWIDDLKLRYGWGITGNADIPGGNAFNRFGGDVNSTFYDINGVNTGVVTGFALTRRGNINTAWEENVSSNFGLDASFWQGKLNLTLDVYKRTVDGLLANPPAAGTIGLAAPAFQNIGEVENSGFDIGIDYQSSRASDFQWNLGLLLSRYKNEIITIDGVSEVWFPTGFDSRIGTINVNRVGEAISSFYGWQSDGLFRSQSEVDAHAEQQGKEVGRIRFKDLNNDGVVDDDDQGTIGSPHPDFTAGINFGAAYRSFDFTLFLYASMGNDIFYYNKLFETFGFFNSNVRSDRAINAFHPTNNPDGTLPILDVNDVFSQLPNDAYVEDGSYLRAKNIQLGYTFPTGILGGVFDNLRVYVQVQNLFTITDYSGIDPVVSNFGVQDSDVNDIDAAINANLWNGFDFGTFPSNRTFMVGVNASF